MKSWMRNTISKFYSVVSRPVAATRDALAERLQSVRKTACLLYNRMLENTGYVRKKLKEIMKNETKEEKSNMI